MPLLLDCHIHVVYLAQNHPTLSQRTPKGGEFIIRHHLVSCQQAKLNTGSCTPNDLKRRWKERQKNGISAVFA